LDPIQPPMYGEVRYDPINGRQGYEPGGAPKR